MSSQKSMIFLGEGGVGKTSLIRIMTGIDKRVERRYLAGNRLNVYKTDDYLIYDYPGQYKHNSLNLPTIPDICVIIYDRHTIQHTIHNWTKKMNDIGFTGKFVFVKNKSDIETRRSPNHIHGTFIVSAKTGHRLDYLKKYLFNL
jgi:GTPase SAR1 family protein